jgi:hypothetical protein
MYRVQKWMLYWSSQRKKGLPVTALSYFKDYGPLVIRDLITQAVIGLAWLTGMLDKVLTATLTAVGFTMPENMSGADARAFAALVGYVVASVLSGVLMHRLTAAKEKNGEDDV